MDIKEEKVCERLKEVRTSLKMKQGDFAKEIKTTQGHVSDIENKRKGVSDRVIEIICLKYGVREDWFRFGEGEMYESTDTDDYSEISTLIGEKDPKAKQAIIDYWKLSDSDKELFWKFAERFLKGAED